MNAKSMNTSTINVVPKRASPVRKLAGPWPRNGLISAK